MPVNSLDGVEKVSGARFGDVHGIEMVEDYGDVRAEYDAALKSAGLYDARDRVAIDVTGKDRATWLHNLVTNAVKTLQPGEGRYAFATNMKGRILFDLNILVREDLI